MALIDIPAALDRAWADNDHVLPLTRSTRLAIFSDIHRGTGGAADDFKHNSRVFVRALDHYLKGGFTYVELGDGDELYENRRWVDIVRTYPAIFERLQKFQADGRLCYILGNHNHPLANPVRLRRSLDQVRLWFPGFLSGLAIRRTARLGERIFLFHGQQADILSRPFFEPVGHLLVGSMWKFLQAGFGLPDPTSAAQNVRKKTRLEEGCLEWARHHGRVAVFGHTHRPLFMSLSLQQRLDRQKEKPYLFNPGSGVHPECVTGLEIRDLAISLVKWTAPAGGSTAGAKRQVLLRKSLKSVLARLEPPVTAGTKPTRKNKP